MVDRAGEDLLRAHVVGRAEDIPLRFDRIGITNAADFGQAEVQHLDEVRLTRRLDQHDVGRLQVTMDHAAGMGLGERLADLEQQVACPRPAKRALSGQHGSEGLAIEQLHGQVEQGSGVATVVYAHGVGRRQAGHGLGFAFESADQLAVLQLLVRQHLERHLATQQDLFSAKHRAHTAATDDLQELVAPVQHLADAHGPKLTLFVDLRLGVACDAERSEAARLAGVATAHRGLGLDQQRSLVPFGVIKRRAWLASRSTGDNGSAGATARVGGGNATTTARSGPSFGEGAAVLETELPALLIDRTADRTYPHIGPYATSLESRRSGRLRPLDVPTAPEARPHPTANTRVDTKATAS